MTAQLLEDAPTSNPNVRQITVKEGSTIWATQFTLIRKDGTTLHVTDGTRVYMTKIFYARKKAYQQPQRQDVISFIEGQR